MKTVFNSAKYLPAISCCILFVMWLVSQLGVVWVAYPFAQGSGIVDIQDGTLRYLFLRPPSPAFPVGVHAEVSRQFPSRCYVGRFRYARSDYTLARFRHTLWIPLPFAITLLLPFAVGPFLRYRFLLWHWFAFTAVLATELAVYSRL
ncbi:hypothetical protein [Anatilimnocola floriformis]|uniref:hypothetical protein n=1 Tax=Anatilimnocola floriformis TaxID=2948575 RepID=UPI0020C273DD|nr:hypothetical protein [Anatilimnocola floriformis]